MFLLHTPAFGNDIANPMQEKVIFEFNFGADWNGLSSYVTSIGSAGDTTYYGLFDTLKESLSLDHCSQFCSKLFSSFTVELADDRPKPSFFIYNG